MGDVDDSMIDASALDADAMDADGSQVEGGDRPSFPALSAAQMQVCSVLQLT